MSESHNIFWLVQSIAIGFFFTIDKQNRQAFIWCQLAAWIGYLIVPLIRLWMKHGL